MPIKMFLTSESTLPGSLSSWRQNPVTKATFPAKQNSQFLRDSGDCSTLTKFWSQLLIIVLASAFCIFCGILRPTQLRLQCYARNTSIFQLEGFVLKMASRLSRMRRQGPTFPRNQNFHVLRQASFPRFSSVLQYKQDVPDQVRTLSQVGTSSYLAYAMHELTQYGCRNGAKSNILKFLFIFNIYSFIFTIRRKLPGE